MPSSAPPHQIEKHVAEAFAAAIAGDPASLRSILAAITGARDAPADDKQPPYDPDAYLTEAEAAEFLKLSMRTLQALRRTGGGPVFASFGGGQRRAAVRYQRRRLIEYAVGRERRSTADPGTDR